MGAFNLIVVVPVIVLYVLFGAVCLKALKIRVSAFVLFVFVISGVVAGVVAIFLYGLLVADTSGTLNSTAEVMGMFGVCGLAAVAASVLSAKLATKYNQSLKSGTPQSGAP